jgi:rod shape determining protein RodA
MIDWKQYKNFDWLMLFTVLIISAIGVILIYSTCHNKPDTKLYINQFIYLLCGLLLIFIITGVDYHAIAAKALYFYIVTVLALIYLLIFGRSIGGSKSWIKIAGISLQPSEFAKIACILLLAYYFSELEEVKLKFKDLLIPGAIIAIPVMLTILQPDLGTALTFVPIFFGLCFIVGVPWRVLLILLLVLIVIFSLGWFIFFKDYQKARLLNFLNSSSNQQQGNYQLIQSKIAVGSGGFWGKGFLLGSQSQLRFVPAQSTDFIFSVLAEEFGFIGSCVVLLLYLILLLRATDSAAKASDRLGIFIISGFISLFLFHLIVNIGMIIGSMPITGIPLPLLSSGGSSLLSFLIGISLIISIRMRRFLA